MSYRRRKQALRKHRLSHAFGQKVAATTPEFESALGRFISSAQAMLDAHKDRFFADARARTGDATFGAQKLTTERGGRYVRVVVSDRDPSTGRSVYCFVDTTNGDILKAASWKAPAKHARGNIFSDNPLSAVTEYGGRYLR